MAKNELFERLIVNSASATYPIFIGQHILSEISELVSLEKYHQILIISNETIAPLYLSKLTQKFQSNHLDCVVLPDGEQYKSQQQLNKIFDRLIAAKFNRDCLLIALGGGVIGDMTGFAASCYQRGVDFIQIPTSFLAQVDASVGGKTAINYGNAKNMIGSFYQPQAVAIDVATLTTLARREYVAGFAEVIKYGLVYDSDFFNFLEGVLPVEASNATVLAQIIARCCHIKAEIVEKDEREQGVRALLNLGHTFAHAFESITNYEQWLHGEAVAIGLVCALVLSYNKKMLDSESLRRAIRLIDKVGLPIGFSQPLDCDKIIELMAFDKKVMAAKKRFILMDDIGKGIITSEVSYSELKNVLEMAFDNNEMKRRLQW